MQIKSTFLPVLLLFSTLAACQKESKSPGLVGLWQIDQVLYQGEDMTPQGRWMRFNEDLSQTSGNGWIQHSIGRYSYANDSLLVENSNGWHDPAGAFVVKLSGDSMTWTRQEGGAPIQISLSRITEIPQTMADALYGYWMTADGKQSLLLRWDRVFMEQSDSGRINGVYRTHGHAPRIQFIYPESKVWLSYTCQSDSLILSDGDNSVLYLRNHHLED